MAYSYDFGALDGNRFKHSPKQKNHFASGFQCLSHVLVGMVVQVS